MKYEGEHRQIVLRGIERAMANGVAQDGGMNEVINLIPRNGSYVPYSPTEVEIANYFPNKEVKMIRVHHTSTRDNTIVVLDDCYYVNPRRQQPHGGSGWVITGRKEGIVKNIVFIGNRMDLETTDGIKHLLWKNGAYRDVDDLNIHENGQFVLPTVYFKVERGIYDGSTIYQSARYVKLHKSFSEKDPADCDQGELSNYVRDAGSVGGDAMALLDSIRHMGGITGYVLVTSAWRVKGSDASNPKYVMASPVLLMGAPENYMKEHVYRDGTAIPNKSFFLDLFGYSCNDEDQIPTSEEWQNYAFDTLWAMADSDSRDMSDLTEKEHVQIETQASNQVSYLRQYVSNDVTNSRKLVTVTAGQGDDAVWTYSNKQTVQQPALVCRKYGLYNHGTRLGSSEKHGEYRGVRITQGSANVLYYYMNQEIPDEYKDEVDRLCIFVSPVISPYKTNDATGVRVETDYKDAKVDEFDGFFFGNDTNAADYGVYHSACGGSFTPVMKSNQEIIDEIKNIAGLYKVAEYQLNELRADEWLTVNLSGGKLSTDRMVQHTDTMLKLSDVQSIGFKNGHIFGYNERLHVYNFQKDDVYRLPYDGLHYYGGAGQYPIEPEGDIARRDISVEVTDRNGSIVVHRLWGDGGKMFNPLISCADIEAKSIRLAYRTMNGVTPYKVGDRTLVPIEIGGIISGYITSDLKPIGDPTMYETTEANWTSHFKTESIQQDSRAYGKNELRVSNPSSTIFEVDKSYKIGNGEIIALARLGIGLSQDNRSKYPLIIFCTDGIYTLSVDASGKYAYSTQDPLSRIVCTNVNGICEIDGAVLFPSEFGLQMVTVDGVKPVVLTANGKPTNCPDDYEDNGLMEYHNAIDHVQLTQLSDAVSGKDKDFRTYIQDSGTYMSYLHALNSVIAYNKEYGYSYLIDLSSWMVTKSSMTFVCDNGDYPKQLFMCPREVEDDVLQQPVFERFDYDSGPDNTQVLLVTRPITLESRSLKTVYRAVLRGEFAHMRKKLEPTKFMGMYVYGSLDGLHWDYLNGTEKELSRFHDIGVETHHVSYKYMMVVWTGNLNKDSHIDAFEVTSMEKYNNKLK